MKLKLSDSLIERIARFDSIFYNGNILHDSGAVKTINFLKTQNSDMSVAIQNLLPFQKPQDPVDCKLP